MTPTPRERDLLAALIAEGTLHGAARASGMAYSTAKNHVNAMYRRTGLRSGQLIAVGVRDGWLTVRLAA